MQLYRYDKDGYLLESFHAYLDPAESRRQGKEIFMIPANCTAEIPPSVKENELAVFKDGRWEVVKDYRGKIQCDSNFNLSTIDYIGEPPEGFVVITEEQAQTILEDKLFYIIQDGELVENPDYESLKASEREALFNAEFFNTSLGWIRRKVTMKDGSIKDFLGDLLLQIKAGLELGQSVEIITYKEPDYTKEYKPEYIVSLQERKNATPEFIQECLIQTVKDFGG